jgi:hypothetical protein
MALSGLVSPLSYLTKPGQVVAYWDERKLTKREGNNIQI